MTSEAEGACSERAALDRPRHSKKLQDRMPTTLRIETMEASSVRCMTHGTQNSIHVHFNDAGRGTG